MFSEMKSKSARRASMNAIRGFAETPVLRDTDAAAVNDRSAPAIDSGVSLRKDTSRQEALNAIKGFSGVTVLKDTAEVNDRSAPTIESGTTVKKNDRCVDAAPQRLQTP